MMSSEYRYIGKDGMPILARDLEDQRDAALSRIEELEARLAKAAELVVEECPYYYGSSSYDKWWDDLRTTLAVEGDKE
jgi:hypothetical protein